MKFGVFILLTFILFSCRKNKFESCDNFEKVVGEWACIDTDFQNKISISENGILILQYTTERKKRYKSISCEYISTSQHSEPYFKFYLNHGYTGFMVNTTFDTIRRYAGAYNKKDTLDTLGYLRRFVRVN